MDEPTMRIGEVARRTGLAPVTIRAWQRRYGLLAPARSAGGQRLYSEADVRVLDEVRTRVAAGWALSVAAAHVRTRGGAATGGSTGTVPTPSAGGRATSPSPRGAPSTTPGPEGDRPEAQLGTITIDHPEIGRLRHDDLALAAVHSATRSMLRASSPGAVVAAVVDLVRDLGGDVVAPGHPSDAVLPVDLGLGETDPMLPSAEPFSVARLRLEAALPSVVEDARHMIGTLRRAGVGGSTTVDDEHLPARRHSR
jgi:hypothetical protein